MNKLIVAALVVSCLGVLGCDERARELAAQASTLLDQRSAQLSRKITAEVDAYSQYSAHAVKDEHDLTIDSLANERAERGNDLEDALVSGKLLPSQWRKHVADYAHADYDIQKATYFGELDAESRFLEQYNQVQIEQDKVTALKTLLQALAKKPGLKNEAVSLADFAKQTKDGFDQKVCDGLKGKTDDGSKKLREDKHCN